MKFTIDPKFLTDVTYKKVFKGYDLEGNEYPISVTGNKDHPEFDQLRRLLSLAGYIHTQTWWNGDKVLKPFSLNGHHFRPGKTFYCAAALGIRFKSDWR